MPSNILFQTSDTYEINSFEDKAFPLGIYTVTPREISPPGRGYGDMHWHEELQYTLLTSGSMTMQVNGEEYPMVRGEALFINRNCVHVSRNMSDDSCYVSVAFPARVLGFFTGSRMEMEYVLPYVNDMAVPAVPITHKERWMREILCRLWDLIDLFRHPEKPFREYRISLGINTIWMIMIENCLHSAKPSEAKQVQQIERVKKMIAFVSANYRDKITVADLADAAGISEAECNRCFRKITGSSPKQYLQDFRLIRAMELLKNTGDSVTQVAMETGFTDSSYFVKCFRKRNGVTPKEYQSAGKQES